MAFYSEMIDDRIEEGLTEEEAIAAVGSAQEIASQIVADIPLSKIAKERIKPRRRLKSWEIVLLALGSPIWLSLAISAVAVMISVYAVLWSLIASLWAVFASFAACGGGGIVAGITLAAMGNGISGVMLIGAALVCAGLSIFIFFGCLTATKNSVLLTKKIVLWTKKLFVKKEVS